ncbi:unnamed protein product [Brassica rapa subsp. narinosa]
MGLTELSIADTSSKSQLRDSSWSLELSIHWRPISLVPENASTTKLKTIEGYTETIPATRRGNKPI